MIIQFVVSLSNYRKRKGKVRRNSNGMVDEMSLYSVDFPNRSEASGSSDLEAIFSAGSLQTCCQPTSNDGPDQRQSTAMYDADDARN